MGNFSYSRLGGVAQSGWTAYTRALLTTITGPVCKPIVGIPPSVDPVPLYWN